MFYQEIGSPRVISLSAELISVSSNKIIAKIGGRYVVFLDRSRSRISFGIWALDGSGGVVSLGVGEVRSPSDVDMLELDDEFKRILRFFIENWKAIVQQRIAETILKKGVGSVPKVSDREALADEIANKMLEKRIIKTFYTISGGKEVEIGVYCYDETRGIYKSCERELEREIEGFVADSPELRVKTTKWVVEEAMAKIKRRTYEVYRYEQRKLVFYDKVFDWNTFIATGDLEDALFSPRPDMVVLHWIPHSINTEKLRSVRQGLEKYIPPNSVDQLIDLFKILAPRSYKAFLSWVRHPSEAEDEAKPRVALLLEIIGYTLYPHEYPFNKAILLIGEGSNGKSTFTKLLRVILGDPNVASLSLRDLDPRVNRFAVAELVDKLANIASEPAKGLFDPTLFKQITGEDPVLVERKYKDPYTTTIYAKMIFTANELPRVTEDTYAFWRRWIVVEFPNRFQPYPGFFEKTFTEDEIEGIIIAALYAFRLVMLRKSFTEQHTKDPREEWLSRSEPVYRVIRAMIDDRLIELDTDGYVVKKDLYSLYTAYTRKLRDEGENVETVPHHVFTQKLEQLFGVRSRQKRVSGRNLRVYIGIRVSDREAAESLIGRLETPRDAMLQKLVGQSTKEGCTAPCAP